MPVILSGHFYLQIYIAINHLIISMEASIRKDDSNLRETNTINLYW